MARINRRSFVALAGVAGASATMGIYAPSIARAATQVKLTLPWLPLGTFSYAFMAKAMGFHPVKGRAMVCCPELGLKLARWRRGHTFLPGLLQSRCLPQSKPLCIGQEANTHI